MQDFFHQQYQAEKSLRPRATEELDTAAALCKVSETPEWLDLSDHTFVLFGAGGIDVGFVSGSFNGSQKKGRKY